MDEPLTGRAIAAGGGALIFALYWLIGGIAIGVVFAIAMQLFPRPSPQFTAIVVAQMGAIAVWLGFVVYRGTKGGRFELRGDRLRYKKFLFWTNRQLRRDATPATMVTHVQGTTYENGPAIVFQTDAGELSIATMNPKMGEALGIMPNDVQLVAPTLVIDSPQFEQLARRFIS